MKKILSFILAAFSLFVFASEAKASSCIISSGLSNTKVIVKVNFVNSSKAKYPLTDVSVFNVGGINYNDLIDGSRSLDLKNASADGVGFALDAGNFSLNFSSVSNYRIDKPICSNIDVDGNIIVIERDNIEYNVDAVYIGPLNSSRRRTPPPTTEVLGANEITVATSTEPVIEPTLIVTPVVETPAPILVTEVLGEEVFRFNIDLRLGMQNDDVSELQLRLQKEGFFKFDRITGYFGPITLQAVKDYQKAKGIPYVTGFCGPLTRAELNK